MKKMLDHSSLKIILIDDEESALDILEILLKQIGQVEIVQRYTNPQKALEEIKRKKVDAVFLDIEMPGINGIDLAEQIQAMEERIEIVFITAYNDYAVQAFEIHSLDYVLKPLQKDRLEKTLNRLLKKVKTSPKPVSKGDQLLHIQCFGNFEVFPYGTDKEPMQWKTAKVKELCAYLVHHRDKHVDKELIIEDIWGSVDYEKAKINLYTTISYLRKSFQDAGYDHIIEKNRNGYKMKLNHAYVDVAEFETKLQQLTSPRVDNIFLYEQLQMIYKENYMEKNGYQWAEGKREALKSEFIALLKHISLFYKEQGEMKKAEKKLKKMIQYDPYSEETIKNLMIVYLKTGKRVEAIRTYEQFKEMLKKEIGLNPEPETVKLYLQILNRVDSGSDNI